MANKTQAPQSTPRVRRNSSVYLQKVKNSVEQAKNYAQIVHGRPLTNEQKRAAIYLGELLVQERDDRNQRRDNRNSNKVVNNLDVGDI